MKTKATGIIQFVSLALAAMLVFCSCHGGAGSGTSHASSSGDMTVDDDENQTEFGDDQPIEGDHVICVTDHGVVAGDITASDANHAAINQIIIDAPEGSVVYFPAGNYYMSSNIGCIQVVGKKNLTILGRNATVINTTYDPEIKKDASHYMDSLTLVLNSCENVTVEGLGFDFYRYVQVCGTVKSVNASGMVLDIDEKFTNAPDKAPLTGNEYIMAVAFLDENGGVFDDYYAPDDGYPGSLNPDGTYTVSGRFNAKTGDRVLARFTIASYAIAAIGLVDSANTTFRNIRSYSAPSTTILLQSGNENLTVDGLMVKCKEDSPMLWGSNVDGIWMQELRGELKLTNSQFYGMGDDALNVHSRPARLQMIAKGQSGKTVVSLINPYNDSTFSEGWGRAGDTLRFYNTDFEVVATARIAAIDPQTGKYEIENIEGELTDGLIVQDMELTPSVTVDNCVVDGGRARAFLIQTSNVSIADCTIKNLALSAIIIAPDLIVWNEMGPAENVVISNCRIENVCLRSTEANYGAIMVKASHDGDGGEYRSIHKNITFKDNRFENTNNKPAMYVSATDGVTISGNSFGDRVRVPVVTHCTDVDSDV